MLHDVLAENFKMRSKAVEAMLQIYMSLKASDTPEKLQPELKDLQRNTVLGSSLNPEALVTFYASLSVC
jgi:hypothetical protein